MDNQLDQQGSEQPNDLFSYIGGQQFQAVDDEAGLVNQLQESAPEAVAPPVAEENADPVAATAEETPPATPVEQAPQNDEAVRLQQRIQELEQRDAQRLAAIAMVATQAREREQTLFEQSLAQMTDEEAQAARTQREYEQLKGERDYLKGVMQTNQNRAAQAQEHVDKTNVAHALLQRLGLPGEDQFVMTALMESASPAEMIAKAQRLMSVYQATAQQQAAAQAQTVPASVHTAGGETAPAIKPQTTPVRKGELIDMMRERQYAVE